MAKLTGLQIQKLLPKTNCKECGSSTCLAFAMKLAAKTAELSECPYASDEAKAVLGAASEPPVKLLELGAGKKLRTGGETVFYRHEKTFVNQTLFAVNINDTDGEEQTGATLATIRQYALERVGERLTLDLVAVTMLGTDEERFVKLAVRALESTGCPLVLNSAHPAALAKAAAAVKGSGSVLCAADPVSLMPLLAAARDNGHALALTAPALDELAALTVQAKEAGFNQLLLKPQTCSLAEQFQTNSLVRKAALANNFKAVGYPLLRFTAPGDLLAGTVEAVTEVCKFGGICVLPAFDPAQLTALFTLRLNIFTDPQKPIQMEPKIYQVGEPQRTSPVFVTTNFSLTYFIVSGEIENSGISAWLVVPECEGMSVLTAWAAGKFSGAIIARFMKEAGIESLTDTREVIIPGYVAQISGELEEQLPGWKVQVGPQEASDIEAYVKAKLL